MKTHLKPNPVPHADIYWQADTRLYNLWCKHHKIHLPVLGGDLTTHPMGPSPQADKTVFKREDRANPRWATDKQNPSNHLLEKDCLGHTSQAPSQRKTGKMPVRFLYPLQARVGSSGKYFSHTIHPEYHEFHQ